MTADTHDDIRREAHRLLDEAEVRNGTLDQRIGSVLGELRAWKARAESPLPDGWAIGPTESRDEVAAITCGALRSTIDRSGVLVTEHRSGLTGGIVGTPGEVARWLLWAFDVAGPTGSWQPSPAEAPWADHPAAMARARALVPAVGAAIDAQPLPDEHLGRTGAVFQGGAFAGPERVRGHHVFLRPEDFPDPLDGPTVAQRPDEDGGSEG